MSETTTPIKIGISGLGRSGHGIHIKGLKDLTDLFQIVAVFDPIKERTEDVKEDLVLYKDYYIGRPPGIRHGPVCTQSGALWLVYLADMYTGIFKEVDDWEPRVSSYLSAAAYR